MAKTPYPAIPVMLVDDEESWLYGFTLTLRAAGITNTAQCHDSREVLPRLARENVSAIALDIVMPGMTGTDLLRQITEEYPHIPVIMVTGLNQIETAVDCMKLGAFDYFIKTTEADRLVAGIKRALEMHELRSENDRLREQFVSDELTHPEAFRDFVTQDPQLRSVLKYIETIAPTGRPVLITGESGAGKELAARALHRLSGRTGPFVALDVAGLDNDLFSDTLFGHLRGAYTGASESRAGMVEQAAGGTLFLDEIGDLPLPSQVKLLRLVQEREYLPLGADRPKYTDARLVVATNQNLEARQKTGAFRKDLYYRLKTHHVHLPPLRERPQDLPLLVAHYLCESARELGKKPPTPPKELFALLGAHHFPGNVRELKAMIYDAVSRHESKILSLDSFRAHIETDAKDAEADWDFKLHFPDRLPTLKETADMLVDEALERCGGNQSVAAQMLGITRQALNKRLKQRGIEF